MSDTSIQARPNPLPVLASPPPKARAGFLWYVKKAGKALASLRLTVFLFVLSMILVFCGTLAMMDQGLFTVLSRYFRSGIAWIPLQLFVRFGQVFFGISPDAQVAGSIPFPGGWLIGAALLVNLIAAHATRFRFTLKRSGILLIHSGLIILMLGELVTGLFSVESSMTIPVGGSSNYVENFDSVELAFVSSANAKEDKVVVVPENQLQTNGTIHNDLLPVDIEVVRYLKNSSVPEDIPADVDNLATRGFGLQTVALEQPPGRGVDADQKRDMPSAYLTFKDKKSGQSLGTYLVSLNFRNAQPVDIDGTPYRVALRLKRNYLPFAFHLEKLDQEMYRGTRLAKRYASLVRVTGENGLDREVLIHMNHPFYFEGQTFYQSRAEITPEGVGVTGLQVVRNPGWPLPYIACTMVSGGMVIHFLLHLLGFFRRKVTL
ncbi:MAG TPA: cytochrome c biogenesis protein ResB [Gemmataceae bacterium]|nr:cytochrome c biogenesis protein ResB [Gemmataceae bacterium]